MVAAAERHGVTRHARGPSEAEFQRSVIELAELLGWTAYHPWISVRSAGGYPDLTLVRDRVVWAELKRAGGKLSPAQVQWRSLLERAGAEIYVWTWELRILDEVHEVLR